MGRKKIEIEYIRSKKIRNQTFKKRGQGLIKKAEELAKLTDANVYLKIDHYKLQ